MTSYPVRRIPLVMPYSSSPLTEIVLDEITEFASSSKPSTASSIDFTTGGLKLLLGRLDIALNSIPLAQFVIVLFVMVQFL